MTERDGFAAVVSTEISTILPEEMMKTDDGRCGVKNIFPEQESSCEVCVETIFIEFVFKRWI